jgi:hypothetical protein
VAPIPQTPAALAPPHLHILPQKSLKKDIDPLNFGKQWIKANSAIFIGRNAGLAITAGQSYLKRIKRKKE